MAAWSRLQRGLTRVGASSAQVQSVFLWQGAIVGVDGSPQMLALAARRCGDHDRVEFREGDATSLPVDDASFDGALCVQVLEYVPDVAVGLSELHRALRPGGRVVIWDVDWATVSWHSADPARMDRVLAVNAEDLTATVQAGVTRKQLNDEIKSTGLFFPIDPGADAFCRLSSSRFSS